MSFSKAIGVISNINECVNFFQWVKSAISSLRSNARHERKLQYEVLELESGLQRLRETLPAMYALIDRAEWRSHEVHIANLLPVLKAAVYDAEDILDEFRWYELKMEVEGNVIQAPSLDFFNSVIEGSFNKVDAIQKRLGNLYNQLHNMGLREVAQRFDKCIRPITSSFPTERKIFGRDEELKEIVALLGESMNSSRACSKRKRMSTEAAPSTSSQVSVLDNFKPRIASVPVLPIVGIGGIGKTTLVQHICKHPQVASHFDTIIWICVSDDFDVKRLTTEVIHSLTDKEVKTDNLDALQKSLAEELSQRTFLMVLDDMWEDAVKENGQPWRRFCAPLKNVLQGSILLVTTRSAMVAESVHTLEPFQLECLKDDVFWEFFKNCIFGHEVSHYNPDLEQIGKSILPKLKGSPLAAKTLGRLLGMSHDSTHWNNILNSELWELRQDDTDILPALRLSYIYLPFHLKRCFSFCAVYPKDYKFIKERLSEIWVAEGFVAPQGNIPLQSIGCQFFEDLINRSFFQNLPDGTYVIHDLIHDMAQLVSMDECFCVHNTSDIKKIPENILHLSILNNIDVDCSNLLRICKHKRLRTLLCYKSLMNTDAIINNWCSELRCMRVLFCASVGSVWELPETMGNMKHLRYLALSGYYMEGQNLTGISGEARMSVERLPSALRFPSTFSGTRLPSTLRLPSALCCLYNLQILYAEGCKFGCLPSDINKLINLQKFESSAIKYHRGHTTHVNAAAAKLIKNFNCFLEDLVIYIGGINMQDDAAEFELKNKKHLNRLRLQWSHLRPPENNAAQVLLHPPTNLKDLGLEGYPGEYLPSWFHPPKMPNLTSLHFARCNGLESILFPNNNGRLGDIIFSSLEHITINGCQNLSSLEHFLHPSYVSAVRKIVIADCKRLVSLPTERFGDFHHLKELKVSNCPNVNSVNLTSSSLKTLELARAGNLGYSIECCSLSYMHLSSSCLMSMQIGLWILPALQELTITKHDSLTFIEGSEPRFRPFSSLTGLTISYCKKLQNLDDLLKDECLPVIERIHIGSCPELRSLPGERFGGFTSLKDLNIWDCPYVTWEGGMVLPTSLQRLSLQNCGDFSAGFPSCLENLSSLQSLQIASCERIACFPGGLWSDNLPSLQELWIQSCPDLVSMGGPDAIASIKKVRIGACPKLLELKQPLRKGDF